MAKEKITGQFDWRVPQIVPSFVQGKDALAIYNSIKDLGLGLGWMDYDENSKLVKGDNVFISAKIDTQLQPLGIRVANLRDCGRTEVMGMVKGQYYTIPPALVLRTIKDSYEKNLPLIKKLTELVEEKNRRLELPALITGFDVQPLGNEGYRVDIIARDDFASVSDERLKEKYHGKTFSEVDEIGLPKFDKNGIRTWYARNEGLSRLYLCRDLDLYSNSGDLADSNADGRVVVVSGEATPQKINEYAQNLQTQRDKQIAQVNDRYAKAEAVLRGEN